MRNVPLPGSKGGYRMATVAVKVDTTCRRCHPCAVSRAEATEAGVSVN